MKDRRGGSADALLPASWRWVRLRELIAEAQPGFACGERDPSGVIQLRMNNVGTRGNIVWDEFIRVPADAATLSKYCLVDGDVVFNNTNSTALVGKTALFRGHEEPVVYSNHFTRLRVHADRLDQSYLASWLLLQWQSKVFEELCNRWIGQSAVKSDKLLTLEIPLPPLPEQRRIAAILNEQMAAVERARAAAEAELVAARKLPEAYLRGIFESVGAQSWPKKQLGDTCLLLPSRSISGNGDQRVQAITTACLTEYGFEPSGIKSARMWATDAVSCVVSPGEVLVARSNTAELVGRVAMFPGSTANVVASDLTIRVQPGNRYIPDFVAGYLSYLYVIGYWREKAGGASGSMKKITRSQLEAEQIPAPGFETQVRIVRLLSTCIGESKRVLDGIREQQARIGQLPAALLRQAFSGEL
jgi:type I restriction enzyme, S subunit